MKTFVGYIISAIMLFFAVIFLMASSVRYSTMRLAISCILFVAGFSLIYFTQRLRPRKIIQRIEVPGKIIAQELRCPNCSASLNVDKIRWTGGVPSVKCSYCGHVFEVSEEPKW